MKPKIVIAICIVAIAAYTAYNNFVRVGPSEETSVRDSVMAFSGFVAMSNSMMAQNLISPTFADKISRDAFLKVIDVKRAEYSAKITSVTFNGDFAMVSYSRKDMRGSDCDPINVNIIGETWARDKANPKTWKLQKLADADTWFRTVECPKKKVAPAPARSKEAQASGEAVAQAKGPEGRAMRKGERYNPAGKRDPFKPLITIGATEAEMMAGEFCEPDREKEFLEQFDLDTLKLTGIILGAKGPLALVETPDGKGYTVLTNTYLGKRCGKVVKIDDKQILLKEQIRKPGGKPGEFTSIDTPMRLRTETEEADTTLPKEQIRKPGAISGQSTIDSPKRLRREEG